MNSNTYASPVTIVAHDAGGAAILASYVEQEDLNALFVLDGPAKKVFQERLGKIHSLCLSEALVKSKWVLTGTGWQSDLEWQAIRQAKAANNYVVSFLDHWINYSERFERNGLVAYPDEIWVGDAHAAEIANRKLPNLPISIIDNPYFKSFINRIGMIENSIDRYRGHQKNILFLSENINIDGFHQNDAIHYFIENLNSLNLEIGQILIRPHPSEMREKYAWVADKFDMDIRVSDGAPLEKEMAFSDIVVGCTTMAMVLGVITGRRVISCIPENKIDLSLPFEQIEKLDTILKKSKKILPLKIS